MSPQRDSDQKERHLVGCTIVARNYTSYARVLASSFLANHPGGRFFVLLVDRNEGHIDPAREPFELVEIEQLDNVADLHPFLFKYTILEANTAIKPFFLEWLIERHGLDNIVYFDPDILVAGSLDELQALVGRHSVVLTPHLDEPIEDARFPTEQAILQSGAYNLGFVAFRVTPTTRRLLRWWQERLYEKCVVQVAEGLFVDQKWMDIVPGMFTGDGGVHIMLDPGYNVAYWNLHGRALERATDGALVVRTPRSEPRPLVFFHFSGIELESLRAVSKHQNRFTLDDLEPVTAGLYRDYAARVLAAGHAECRSWSYVYGAFSNGARIPDAARALYHELTPTERRRFGDPFVAAPQDGVAVPFFDWLNEAVGRRSEVGHLTRLLARAHASRPDLLESFPQPGAADFADFSSWMRDAGQFELRLDERFLRSLYREPSAGWRRSAIHRTRRAVHAAKVRAKRRTVAVLGPERTAAVKRWLRGKPRPAVSTVTVEPAFESLGVNLVGYLEAETGMGEAARSLARAFAQTPIPISLHAIDLNVIARRGDSSLSAPKSDFPHPVNLLVVNADQVPAVREHLGSAALGGRYNVGLWLWEQDVFPEAWRGSFAALDEVWAPSSFCVDTIATVSPVPVRRVPLPVEARPGGGFDRAHFGLADEPFVFLFAFNYLSYFERKNPIAVVEAFRRAFGDDPGALLVLKTSQKDFAPDEHERLRRAVGDASNVRLVEEYLSRDEVDALMRLCDCYVSLHRSEGYGLTLAEAMAYGKPVIATPYSAVTDFFNLNNGLPVRYRLVTLERDEGPYAAGTRWADPDVDHAAERMRAVRADAALRRCIGERARTDVAELLSPAAVARVLQRRLDEIARLRRRGSAMLPPR